MDQDSPEPLALRGSDEPVAPLDGAAEVSSVRAPRPWWIPHFLGRVPLGLEPRYVSLVGVVALAALFENYDISMLSAAMKQIREGFGLGQAEFTSLMAWSRLGAIPGFLVLPLADRLGRRRVFLGAIAGMSACTVVSGFAQTAIQFVVLQMLTRTFVVATMATAVVIIAEELPARHRGWGIGMLGAIGACGFGLGAILYSLIEWLPFGWRSLYMVGCVPLFLFPIFRRKVPETKRFTSLRDAQSGSASPGFFQPLVELAREYPGRCVVIAVMATSFALGSSPAFTLLSDFVQTTHGWSPGAYSAMALVSGMFGIIGNPAMGWGADRVGRRPVAMLAFGVFPLIALAIYFGPALAVPLVWIPFVFVLTGSNVLMRIISSELFPTSSRNTAMGLETLSETLGAAMGFFMVGAMTATGASIAPAAVGVSVLTLLAAIAVWTLPETAGKELEATSEVD